MAGDEHERERVVEIDLRLFRHRHRIEQRLVERLLAYLATQSIQCLVARHRGKPGCRTLRRAVDGPAGKCRRKRVLQHVFDKREMRRPEHARETRGQAPRFPAEQTFDQ